MKGSDYYVTLCVKTPTGTRAISSYHNAKFRSLSSAEKYRDSLIPTIESINKASSRPVGPLYLPGERIVVITDNPAPDISYVEHTSSKRTRTKKEPEYVQLYHGPRVKKSTAKWLERQQESATIVLFAIIAVMLAIALCNKQP